MTMDAGSGPRRLFPRRRRNGNGDGVAPEEIASEFTTEELQEFITADYLPSDADPEFRESLRRKLWALLESERPPSSELPPGQPSVRPPGRVRG
jgi:hypothetical protein